MLRFLSYPCRLAGPFPKSATRSLSSSALPVAQTPQNEGLNQPIERNSITSRTRLDQDEPRIPTDISQWVDLLTSRYRIHGFEGVEATWRDLRNNGVDLPVQGGKEVTKLWRDFLEHDGLRNTVVSYAFDLRLRTGEVYTKLYHLVMSRILLNSDHKLEDALKTHDSFQRNYVITPRSFENLAESAVKTDHGLATFKEIYRRCLGISHRKTYDKIIPILCERGAWNLALEWHKFLVKHRDLPNHQTPIVELHRMRPDLAAHLDTLPPIATTYQAKRIAFKDEPSSSALEDFGSDFLDIKLPPATANIDPLSDHICARLFATRSFGIGFIIAGLKLFESRKIGPLAMRELFLRAESPEDAMSFIHILREADISIIPTSYTRVIKTFAMSRQFDELQSLVQSDLHPDTLDDLALQIRLLKMYQDQEDRLSAQRTTAIIKLISDKTEEDTTQISDPSISHRRIAHGQELKRLSVLLEDKIAQGTVEQSDFRLMCKRILRPRLRNHTPANEHIFEQDLSILCNFCILALKSGVNVPPYVWTEVLKRYGMTGKFIDVMRLSTLLVRTLIKQINRNHPIRRMDSSLYRASNLSTSLSELPGQHPMNYVGQVLSPGTLEGIIAWGFKIGLNFIIESKTSLANQPAGPTAFFLGLRVLQGLAKHGFDIQTSSIAEVLRKRLSYLSSPQETPSRRHNIIARELNPWSLEELLFALQRVWTGPPLFPELFKAYENEMTGPVTSRDPVVVNGVVVPPMLEGLLDVTSQYGSKPLESVERIAKRLQLRLAIFGPLYWQATEDREVFYRSMQQQAIQTDAALIRRRKFGGYLTLAEISEGSLFSQAAIPPNSLTETDAALIQRWMYPPSTERQNTPGGISDRLHHDHHPWQKQKRFIRLLFS
jgi:hypothetical protein